jgi:hypothetical protein
VGKPNSGLLPSAAGERTNKVRKRVNSQDTSAETKPDLQLEIAHILLIDVVGYSKLLVDEQIDENATVLGSAKVGTGKSLPA